MIHTATRYTELVDMQMQDCSSTAEPSAHSYIIMALWIQLGKQ